MGDEKPERNAEPLDHSRVVNQLLEALGDAFDLAFETATGSLGDGVRQRLESLDVDRPPEWGTSGAIAQVAKHGYEALDFYYRPHLFPDMSDELRLAHHLQFDLLPRHLPSSCPLEIAAVLESYCHLSGDLIGWRREGEDFFLWIADVAGHGVRAGLAAAVIHFLLSGIEPRPTLAELAKELNDQMLAARNPRDRQALYITAFLMRISADGSVRYASAGHPPMLCRTAKDLSRLPAQGPPIGLLPAQVYSETDLALARGDLLFLYTDGLLEARTPDEDEFGLERIESRLRSASSTPLDLSHTMYRAVRAHKDTQLLDDDLTFLAARIL